MAALKFRSCSGLVGSPLGLILLGGILPVLITHEPMDQAERKNCRGKPDNRERFRLADIQDDELSHQSQECNEDDPAHLVLVVERAGPLAMLVLVVVLGGGLACSASRAPIGSLGSIEELL